MSENKDGKATAAGGGGVGPSRRTWDADAFADKARERDREDRERAEENEERVKSGKKPLKRRREELPKPTQALQARSGPLGIEKNLGKTYMVEQSEGQNKRGPGFHCELCSRTLKDSIAYLDHINGRMHLRRLGQTTQVSRSSLDQVRAKIASLRARSADVSSARAYDFEARLKELADAQEREKAQRKEGRREEKRRKKQAAAGAAGAAGGAEADEEAMAAMGFGGFGSSKKR